MKKVVSIRLHDYEKEYLIKKYGSIQKAIDSIFFNKIEKPIKLIKKSKKSA